MGLTEAVLRHPKLVIALLAISALGFGAGLTRLTTDTDVTRDLPQDLEAKRVYDRIDELFPSKEVVVVGVVGEDLFSVESIARLDRLAKRIEALPDVQSVLGPTTARIISAIPDGMQVKAAADPLPATPEEARAFRDRLLAQPLFKGTVVSADGKAMAMLVMVKAGMREADCAEKLIKLAADPAASEGLTLLVTGRPAATYWSKVIMGRDMGVLSSVALLVIVALLLAVFRSARGVILPVVVVVTSVIWSLGLMGYVGVPITHSTEILPILLIAVGVADSIHILKGFYSRARETSDAHAAVRATMQDLNRPVMLTSVTTALGFLALNSSGVDSIMTLGFFTAFGVMAAMLFSLTFLPAALAVLPLPKGRPGSESSGQRFVVFERLAGSYAHALVAHKGKFGLGIAAIVALAIVGATRVPVEFSNITNFRSDHPFRVATEQVNAHFASATSLSIVVEGGEPDAIKDPEILAKMDALEGFLREQPHVGSIQSITGFIKQMNRVLNGDTPEDFALPPKLARVKSTELVEENGVEVEREVEVEVPGRELVAQYLALYEMSGKPEDFANAVTYDYSTARINVLVDSDRSSVITDLHNAISGFIAERFGGLKVQLTGMAELIRAVNDLVIRGQAWSILTSLLLVFVVTAFVFRSFVLGLFSTLPLFFSLFLNFGTMGLSGIALNIMTMATSSIAVGVGVDYAIHFVHRYESERRAGLDYSEAAVATMRASGVAIFVNALTVASGFFALFFSEFRGVAHMGLLIALTMVTSAFAALTVLPVMFAGLRPKAFKGPEPETSAVQTELQGG
ncbi:MAG: efflux RND transporter permease subunit [Myxococcales bacterium]